jgi:hypothetical protein
MKVKFSLFGKSTKKYLSHTGHKRVLYIGIPVLSTFDNTCLSFILRFISDFTSITSIRK